MRKAMLAVRSYRRIGIGRAEAMAYRDARRQAMTEADWSSIETRLRRGEAKHDVARTALCKYKELLKMLQ